MDARKGKRQTERGRTFADIAVSIKTSENDLFVHFIVDGGCLQRHS
jgi:hypothetical protein